MKCPFCVKDHFPEDGDEVENFCMNFENGKWGLKRNHTYYYQIQLQMVVQYCDFVVWTKSEFVTERVKVDHVFLKLIIAR